FGDVPDDPGEIEVVPDLGHGKGDTHGKFAAVPALGLETHVPADHPGLPGGQVAPQVSPVFFLIGGRNQDFQVLAQGLVPAVTEHVLGPPVVADDDMVFVDGNDGVGGAVDDAGVDFLLLLQILELADQPLQEVGEGAGNEPAQPLRGEIGQPGGEELAVQDEIELIRP